MAVALGIDTGGTYTDAVLVEYETNEILAQAKAPTTRHDLALGIGKAMRRVLAEAAIEWRDVRLVSVSTTLATNAIVEGGGAPACALLIGYEGRVAHGPDLAAELGCERHALIRGGHLSTGEEQAPLDLAAARAAILEHAPHVQAFAVSGYFGTRQPTHELAVRDLVRRLTGLPVTCGHELTHQLDALRRAATVALNARLIPLLGELVAAVRGTMAAQGLEAPLMVVKGDGSLMSAEVAMERPIETILSGPAASVVGARHLAGGRDVVVVDMGGTTTDIAVLREGRPRLNPRGAQVGRWRTMVEAVDVHTVGLGGDSRVWLDEGRAVRVGPRRAVPVSWLAARHPGVVDDLERRMDAPAGEARSAPPELLVLQRPYEPAGAGQPPFAEELRRALEEGPLPMRRVYEMMEHPGLYRRYLDRLEADGLVVRSAFTPTDAAHVLGRFVAWDARAAGLVGRLLARRLDEGLEAFCWRVLRLTTERIARELVAKALQDEDGLEAPAPSVNALVDRALGATDGHMLRCSLSLRPSLVAVGAPVEVYLPEAAEALHTELTIPPHSEVANAVGAVVGSVVSRVRALVLPQAETDLLRVHLPGEVAEFASLEEALGHAERRGRALAVEGALRSGAGDVEIQVLRSDHTAPVADGWGEDVYVQTTMELTAVGRPVLAPR